VPHLSSKSPIAYVEIRVFSHATEDSEKVQTATRNLLPETLLTESTIKQTALTGHYGNSITLIETTLTNRQALPSILNKLSLYLSALDKEQLATNINQHIEKHNLYLRFDKQNAYLGTAKLAANDPIHVKIHFKNKAQPEIVDICQKAGLLP
jgi:RNA binding exosome subunit